MKRLLLSAIVLLAIGCFGFHLPEPDAEALVIETTNWFPDTLDVQLQIAGHTFTVGHVPPAEHRTIVLSSRALHGSRTLLVLIVLHTSRLPVASSGTIIRTVGAPTLIGGSVGQPPTAPAVPQS